MQQGSGKTLAFGLPIIQQLLAEGSGEGEHQARTRMPPSPLRALILLPTRELALQVTISAGMRLLISAACQLQETLLPLRALILLPTRELTLQVITARLGGASFLENLLHVSCKTRCCHCKCSSSAKSPVALEAQLTCSARVILLLRGSMSWQQVCKCKLRLQPTLS